MKRKLYYLDSFRFRNVLDPLARVASVPERRFFRIRAQARFPPLTRVQSTFVPEKKVTASFLEQRLFCPRAKL